MNDQTVPGAEPGTDAIVAYLSAADERCPKCRYHLRGNPSNRCPECGTVFQMHLGAEVGGEAWWWTAVFGIMATAAPIVGYFIVRLYVISAVPDSMHLLGIGGRDPEMITQMLNLRTGFFFALLTAGLLMALAWLIGGRVSWRHLSRRKRKVFGLLGGAMPVVMLAVLALYIIIL